MPSKCSNVATEILLKHFNQWCYLKLLPLALGGDKIPAQALTTYLIEDNSILFTGSCYSPKYHCCHVPYDKGKRFDREYILTNEIEIEKLVKDGDMWIDNHTDHDLNTLLVYI